MTLRFQKSAKTDTILRIGFAETAYHKGLKTCGGDEAQQWRFEMLDASRPLPCFLNALQLECDHVLTPPLSYFERRNARSCTCLHTAPNE